MGRTQVRRYIFIPQSGHPCWLNFESHNGPKQTLGPRSPNEGRVSPPNRTRRDELVEAVVDSLKPWKNHKSRDTVTAEVNQTLNVLLEWVLPNKPNFDRRAIRKHAEKLDRALSKVEKLLESSPGLLALVLFDPRPVLQGDYFPQALGNHREMEARRIAFGAELKRLRDVCARDYGDHPNYDRAKRQTAWWSYGLMQKCSDGKITGTENQAFRVCCTRSCPVNKTQI